MSATQHTMTFLHNVLLMTYKCHDCMTKVHRSVSRMAGILYYLSHEIDYIHLHPTPKVGFYETMKNNTEGM